MGPAGVASVTEAPRSANGSYFENLIRRRSSVGSHVFGHVGVEAGPAGGGVLTYSISEVGGFEILDSRGRPTLEVRVVLGGGQVGVFGVPSGASKGRGEAVERRDGDPARFGGDGVTQAVSAVNGEIADLLAGREVGELVELDALLVDLDGTADRHRLGANSIVGVSVAAAKAMASAEGMEVWEWLAGGEFEARLPVPHFNVVNGGAHAPGRLAFQEFMIAPLGAPDYPSALRAGAEIYTCLRRALVERGLSAAVGDEGGFCPDVGSAEVVLDLLVEATVAAGYRLGRGGVAFAIDPAASGFAVGPGIYQPGDTPITATELIDYYESLVERFPLWSIEDGLAEDDHDGWVQLTARLGGRVQLVGDDNFVTNAGRIRDAQAEGIANASLIKVNQVGTLSECMEAVRAARAGGYAAMVSHRSGETMDTFVADLAVGVGCGQLKAGAPARGERVAKYNRLLQISAHGGLDYGIVR